MWWWNRRDLGDRWPQPLNVQSYSNFQSVRDGAVAVPDHLISPHRLGRNAVGVAFVSLFVCFVSAKCADSSINSIRQSFANLGPLKTLETYFNCHNGPGYRLIGLGDRRAVKLAVDLLSFSDACYTEELQSALTRAMIVAPRNVLPFLGKTDTLSPDAICVPSLSDDMPKEGVHSVLLRIRRSLARVADKGLSRPKAACLRAINDFEGSEQHR